VPDQCLMVKRSMAVLALLQADIVEDGKHLVVPGINGLRFERERLVQLRGRGRWLPTQQPSQGCQKLHYCAIAHVFMFAHPSSASGAVGSIRYLKPVLCPGKQYLSVVLVKYPD
jgi:hypothetical protein